MDAGIGTVGLLSATGANIGVATVGLVSATDIEVDNLSGASANLGVATVGFASIGPDGLFVSGITTLPGLQQPKEVYLLWRPRSNWRNYNSICRCSQATLGILTVSL